MNSVLQGARRIVVKVGSSLVTNEGRGVDAQAIGNWSRQLAALAAQGREVVMVSSGAIAEGMKRLGWTTRPKELHELQAAAADDEARRVAMQEGAILEKARANDQDVGLILWDMAQAAQLDASSRLAGNLHSEISEAALSRSRGVKQAPFRVLVGASMPASLVEVGFITNPEEEKLLFSEAHQARLTDALIQGLGRFIATLRANP